MPVPHFDVRPDHRRAGPTVTTAWAKRAAEKARRTPLDLVPPDDPVLHQAALPVDNFGDESLDVLVHRMLLTCRANRGVAIAAPQVGVALQVVVVDEGDRGVVFCNPVVEAGGKLVAGTESCLSLPGRIFQVPRHHRAVVVGQDLNGEPFGADVAGFHARKWQHEAMHLQGRLLSDEYPEIRELRLSQNQNGA